MNDFDKSQFDVGPAELEKREQEHQEAEKSLGDKMCALLDTRQALNHLRAAQEYLAALKEESPALYSRIMPQPCPWAPEGFEPVLSSLVHNLDSLSDELEGEIET